MTDVAIHGEELAEQYRIGEREKYRALREVMTEAATAPTVYLRGDDRTLEFDLDPPFPMPAPILLVGIDDARGRRIFLVSSQYSQPKLPALDRPTTVVCTIPDLCLQPEGIRCR